MSAKTVTMVRIYIKEGDKIDGHDLMRSIFKLLHEQHKVHGVTVFAGLPVSAAKVKCMPTICCG